MNACLIQVLGKRCRAMCGVFFVVILSAGCGGGLTADTYSDYDTLIDSGWAQYNLRNYTEAYRLFLRAKASDSTKPEAYIGCGWTLLRRQYPDSSMVVFRTGFPHIATLADSVDAICGLAGAYLANGNNNKVATILTDYPVGDVTKGFPFKKHDVLIEAGELELVQAMAFYRLGWYIATSASDTTLSADPNNALYHLNKVLANDYTYTTPEKLIEKLTEALDSSDGGLVL